MSRIGRVLDASDPRVDTTSRGRRGTTRREVRAGRDYAIRNPEDALLVRVNDDEGPLTSVDRARLRAMGYTPWDERPGHDGQSYAEAHDVSHDELYAEEAVARLRRQHENRPPLNLGPRATDKQQALIDRLLMELATIDAAVHDVAREWISAERVGNRLTIDRAREVITRLKDRCGYEADSWKKRADFAPPAPPAPVEVEGMYRYDGHLYQVMRGRDSGRLYAKLITFVEGKKRPNLTHVPGMMRKLRPEHLVPSEEAQELTRKTGWCVFGHFLTNPVSIARGMGPKCWERYGG